jgi:hypothetical protein
VDEGGYKDVDIVSDAQELQDLIHEVEKNNNKDLLIGKTGRIS